MDSPASTLGRSDAERLFALIARLKARGHSVVYISHFIDEVREVCDRIVVLRDGQVVGGGPATMTPDEIVRLMVGRTIEDLFPRTPRHAGEALLEVDAFVPGAATFTLHRGEILGIAGLVGAGRTELLRAIFGLDSVRAGRVRVGSYHGAAAPHHLHPRSSFASSTPTEDNERVYFAWSTPEDTTLLALDHNGSQVWRKNLGPWVSQHGFGTSPILFQNLVIVNNAQDDKETESNPQP